MDFFSAQDKARKKTGWLIFLFAMAVVSLVVVTNIFLMFALNLAGANTLSVPSPEIPQGDFWATFSWSRFWAVGIGVSLVILLGSMFRSWSLGKGGRNVAEMMGGTLVSSDSRDPDKRRLLNIVEEISIASGTPVPLVYIMENEPGINAFAAGHTTGDAVIAVTRGTMEKLNRSELQGVIAHEFSHILNGDMRLNMRLVGVLFGILMIGLIGRFLMRSATYSGSSRSSGGGNSGVALLALGAGLAVLGWVGTLFGNIIKASVSRQREYLADASAVQFTRDPDGIAGALKKIGGISGSLLRTPDAAEFSHTYFSVGVRSFLSSIFATHPPLDERIRRIQPYWDGEFTQIKEKTTAAELAEEDTRKKTAAGAVTAATVLSGAIDMINQAGQPTAEQVSNGSRILQELPDDILQSSREPFDSRAVIYALLLDHNRDVLDRQLLHLFENSSNTLMSQVRFLMKRVFELPPKQRLPLIDLAMPALRQLSANQYVEFKENLDSLIHMDAEVTLFEWSLYKIVIHSLDIEFGHQRIKRAHYSRLSQLYPECSILLSYLARATPGADERNAFRAAIQVLNTSEVKLLARESINLELVNDAVDKLARLKPLLKPGLLKACAACIAADEKVTASEMELLRALSAALDCPLPPLPEDLPHTNQ